ncbi:Aste57867_16356 [Aphanomyces stellatus]|uniref:Aste57867_16356 protein n=1 Tax=Aphanomyces stellatus TaxID=120398 RepID=A0A485L677_9STRA|nr:hypothetical protein As57867_016299 [Aphanomyces stellatus]VFT93132.1 Aste57867_16356 [Aphanomyces stellatus]
MAGQINLDELDETINLGPEDDDLLDYFLSGATGTDGILDDLTLSAAAADLELNIPPPTGGSSSSSSEFGYTAPASQRSTPSSLSYSNASIDTASTTSGEYDAPDSPTGTGDNDLDTDEEKRRKRLERNRISARDSRARKKQYLELLKKKVSHLTKDIGSARGQHLELADETLATLKAQLVESLYEKVADYPPNSPLSPDVDDELRNGVRLLPQRFGPNSDERRAVVNYHFQQLDSLLLPPYTRFLLWMSIQEESFFTKSAPTTTTSKKAAANDERKDIVTTKDGLWSALTTELALTYEQEEKIKSHYRSGDTKTAKLERRKIAMAVTYLNQLKQNMAERAAAVQSHADSIQAILTPEQTVRYQQWVIRNRTKYSGVLKEKSLQFANAPVVDPSAKISTILRKPDEALTVEDVTTLLASLSKQHVTQQNVRP